MAAGLSGGALMNTPMMFPGSAAQAARFREVWDWIAALDAFDYCDPKPLEALLRGGEAVPDEIRSALADIVAGVRKPNKKAAAKLKVLPAERMMLAMVASRIIGLCDIFRCHKTFIACKADSERVEPIDVIRELDTNKRTAIAGTAAEYGISVETVENLLRDLKEKMRKWPVV
jgi:hypothetical protein